MGFGSISSGLHASALLDALQLQPGVSLQSQPVTFHTRPGHAQGRSLSAAPAGAYVEWSRWWGDPCLLQAQQGTGLSPSMAWHGQALACVCMLPGSAGGQARLQAAHQLHRPGGSLLAAQLCPLCRTGAMETRSP